MKIRVLAILAVLAIPAAALSTGEPQIKYPELGGVDQQTKFYENGEFFYHPAGTVYKRIDGNWVLQTNPVRALPEPASWILVGVGAIAAGWLARRRKSGSN